MLIKERSGGFVFWTAEHGGGGVMTEEAELYLHAQPCILRVI